MVKIDATADRLEVVQAGNLFAYLGGFFLGLAALQAIVLVILLATGRGAAAAGLIGPLLVGGLVGWMFGRMPRRRVLAATRGGAATCTAVTLFGRSEVGFAAADVSAAVIAVGVYWSFFALGRRDATPVMVLTFPKRWTWDSAAGAELLGHARRIAGFFAVPLDGAPPA